MLDVVIAHYNENIEWVQKLDHQNINNIHIYTKYSNIQEHDGVRQKKIQDSFEQEEYFLQLNPKVTYHKSFNIGRESETYLRYCYEYYNNLPNSVIFLQGELEPHTDIESINKWIDHLDSYEFTPNISVDTIFANMELGHMPAWYGKCDVSKYNCFTWMRTYVDPKLYPYKNNIYYGACFGVSKNRILSRPREYYSNLIDKEFNVTNPETCHFAERMWFYIFNCHKIDYNTEDLT